MNKVIDFSKAKSEIKKVVSDKEINALFLGLVRIIKKNAVYDVEENLKKEIKDANKNFSSALQEINFLQNRLKEEIEKNVKLTLQVENQKRQICYLVKKLN